MALDLRIKVKINNLEKKKKKICKFHSGETQNKQQKQEKFLFMYLRGKQKYPFAVFVTEMWKNRHNHWAIAIFKPAKNVYLTTCDFVASLFGCEQSHTHRHTHKSTTHAPQTSKMKKKIEQQTSKMTVSSQLISTGINFTSKSQHCVPPSLRSQMKTSHRVTNVCKCKIDSYGPFAPSVSVN